MGESKPVKLCNKANVRVRSWIVLFGFARMNIVVWYSG